MHNSKHTDNKADDLILKFADESFSLREAIEFESMIKTSPDIFDQACINRSVRLQLTSLPEIKARPGFEQRLMIKLELEKVS